MDLGLHQGQVADRLGIERGSYRAWEAGEVESPGVRHWPGVLRFLGYDPLPPPASLPEALLAARRRLGLSQLELADRLGVWECSVADWERGGRPPNARHAGRLEGLFREVGLAFTLDDPEDDSFAGRLRSARRRLGLTQQEMAERVGVGRDAVSEWESGRVQPQRRHLRAVQEALGGL